MRLRGRGKKESKDKEEAREQRAERAEQEQLSSLDEPLLTLSVWGIVAEHTPDFEASLAPHAWIDRADCWHRVCGEENQVALRESL